MIYESPLSQHAELVQKGRPVHESLVAEPPLLPDVALWMAGTHERRNAWVEKSANAAGKLKRKLFCNASLRRIGKGVINRDILAGECPKSSACEAPNI